MDSKLLTLSQWIEISSNIVVLSGAGMSTESGIPDFRSDEGMWNDTDLLDSMSYSYLRRYPEQFWPKFKRVFMLPEYLSAPPHPGYLALVEIEGLGRRMEIYTQNVDGLHQLAGSHRVRELHGSIRKAHCPRCGHVYSLDYLLEDDVPRCNWINIKGSECGSILHPDTVLFEQPVRHFEEAVDAVKQCDLMLVLGTSLTVDPVAELPGYAVSGQTKLVIVNLEETEWDRNADLVIHEKVGSVLGQVADELRGRK